MGNLVTMMEGGSALSHLGSRWNSSSEMKGMKGEMSLSPPSRQEYSTWRAVKMAAESLP